MAMEFFGTAMERGTIISVTEQGARVASTDRPGIVTKPLKAMFNKPMQVGWTVFFIEYENGSGLVISHTDADQTRLEAGTPGKSAYELAVENGFAGSLQDWLNSLAAMRVEIISTHGTVLTENITQTVLSAQVWRGSVNITDQIDASRFIWTRHSMDTMADQIWNDAHAGMKSVTVNTSSVVYEATFNCDILEEG